MLRWFLRCSCIPLVLLLPCSTRVGELYTPEGTPRRVPSRGRRCFFEGPRKAALAVLIPIIHGRLHFHHAGRSDPPRAQPASP